MQSLSHICLSHWKERFAENRKSTSWPLRGLWCRREVKIDKPIEPTFTMSIGGMDCCTDEQRGIPSCPEGYKYFRDLGARNGQCYPIKPKNNGSD